MLKQALGFMIYDKPKSFGILAGIIIAVFLIGQQLSIFFVMLADMKSLTNNASSYIWVVSNTTTSTTDLQKFDVRVERELYSIQGIKEVFPLVIGNVSARFPNGTKQPLTLIGTKAPFFVGGATKILSGTKKASLINDGAIFTDELDASTQDNIQIGDSFEINGKRVYIAGKTYGEGGFGANYAFTTIERVRALANISTDKVSALLISIISPDDEKNVIEKINKTIGGVKAWTAEELGKQTVDNILATSSIALSFGMMIMVAFVSGFIIVGLTLYSSVNDRIRDYGTIKAIGGDDRFLTKFILIQSISYGFIGYTIAMILLYLFKLSTANSKLQLNIPLFMYIGLAALTVIISVFGSWFAIRKVNKLEPVQVFRM